ncbi:MAG: Calx-beta domain-containing protein [Phycisphaeraceae bacterium]
MSATDALDALDPHDHDADHGDGDNELVVDGMPTPEELADADLFEEAIGAAGGSNTSGTPVALADTFKLHSLAGATKVIYLDFDGHTTSGTSWNSAFTGGAAFTTAAYDFDGNTSSFSSSELTRIQYIWQRVAEDFAPFNVDVTTEAPANLADLAKSGSGDTRWGVRVVIGGSSSDWFGSGAGGVAYLNSFNSSVDTPVFVFEDQLGNGHEKYTAEAASHEAGHALGLSHDGAAGTGYYQGHGSGVTGWAPLMGVGYYQNLSQWSKGQYSGANQKQDDLAIITTNNGFGYRADDYGNTMSTAGALLVSGSSVSASGIIERNTDSDFFSFAVNSGTASLSVAPVIRGANLDVKAELLNASGVVIASSNPADLLSASISMSLSAGTYYLKISGAGKGDPLTTGYTNYGSLGQYFITGTINAAPQTATISIGDVTVNENAGTATFTATLSKALGTPVTVVAATANGSALAGSDYAATMQTLVFAAGQTSTTFTVNLLNDAVAEGTENFFVNLSSAVGATIADSQAAATITDDDLSISVNDAAVVETNPAFNGALRTTTMTFTVKLSKAATKTVTVNYATASGTALSVYDFIAKSGKLTFNAGQTSKTVAVSVIGDRFVEGSETLFLNLSSPVGATIADSQGRGTIVDNDVAPSSVVRRSNVARGAVIGGDSPDTSDDLSAFTQANAGALASFASTLQSKPVHSFKRVAGQWLASEVVRFDS